MKKTVDKRTDESVLWRFCHIERVKNGKISEMAYEGVCTEGLPVSQL